MHQSTTLEIDSKLFLLFDLANISANKWKNLADFGEIAVEKDRFTPLAAIYHAGNHFTIDIKLNDQTWFYNDKTSKITAKKKGNAGRIAAVIYAKCLN